MMARGLFDCELDQLWPPLSPGDDASLQLDVGFAVLNLQCGLAEEAFKTDTSNWETTVSEPFKDAIIKCAQKRSAGLCTKAYWEQGY